MKQNLHTKLTQSLKLTPQMKQGLDLLQLNNIDLQQVIAPILAQNPFLIQKDPLVESEVIAETEQAEASWETYNVALYTPDQEDRFNFSDPFEDKLKQALQWELNSSLFSEEDVFIATIIIDALDEQGYLTETVANLEKLFQKHFSSISRTQIEEVRQKLMLIEPYGIASQNLQEFLLCQLSHLICAEPVRKIATALINEHIDYIATQDIDTLRQKTLFSTKEITEALNLIHQLRPRPWLEESEPQLISPPDLMLQKHHEVWKVSMNNQTLCRLYLDNAYYGKVAVTCSNNDFFLSAYREASHLIFNMKRRTNTLLKAAQAIVDYQTPYLNSTAALKPLDLNLLSEQTQLHPSTLSRAIKNKFMDTPQGVFALKKFLSGAFSKTSGLSTHTLLEQVKKLINEETPTAPLSDQAIADILESRCAISVARRTIAKYRSTLGILPASLRKIVLK